MLVAMAGFTLEDAFIKQLSSTVSICQILMVVGFFGAVIFALLALTRGRKIFVPSVWTRATIARMIAETIAAVAFVTSLSLVPISTVAAVFQVTPLTITMGAALFLGERVDWRRWTAVGVGFSGVLLIIRPGFTGFDPSVLWVLVAAAAVQVLYVFVGIDERRTLGEWLIITISAMIAGVAGWHGLRLARRQTSSRNASTTAR